MSNQYSDSLFNPYPGLRPFQSDEDYLFFGREEQTAELLRRLSENRFVAVVGTSGSGKSSLVRCGLLSELHGGGLVGAGSHWEVATMRPGGDPMRHLAEALISAELYDPDDSEAVDRVMATLKRSDAGLVEAARQSDLEEGGNLLIVVDQFEEIFRFHEAGSTGAEEAPDFIQLLLAASRDETLPAYVILTMRSDFLGDCSRFNGLAEAVNGGEYLIPRLNRDQTRTAIEGPAKVAGGAISWRLLVKLLNDLEGQTDRLPVLQHGLMRLWDAWARDHEQNEPLDLRHYEIIGGLSEALSIHADEIYKALPNDKDRLVAAKLFKALTERAGDNRGIRRPSPMRRLQAIAGDDQDAVAMVINAYRQPGVTFLMPGEETALEEDTVIDISHESLMRVWKRLQSWVEDECQSARIYRRLHETAELHAADRAGLYHDPDLQIAQAWRDETSPNDAWAEQYGGAFERTITFLEQSEEEARRAEREAEAARQREVEQAKALAEAQARSAKMLKRFAVTVSLAGLLAVALAVSAYQQSKMAKRAQVEAQASARDAKHEQGKTWLANARASSQQKNHFGAQIKAARALGFEGFGRENLSTTQKAAFPVLLDPNRPEWEVAQQAINQNASVKLLWSSGALPQHPGKINDLAVSPDDRLIVSVSEPETEHSLSVWDGETGAALTTLDSPVGNPEAVAFSPDGRFLAVSGRGGVGFFRCQGNAFSLVGDAFAVTGAYMKSLAFSGDGALFAMGDTDGQVFLWPQWDRFESSSFPRAASFTPVNLRVADLEFSPSNPRLLAVAMRGKLDVVKLLETSNASDGKVLATLEVTETSIEPGFYLDSVSFSSNGRYLAAAGRGIQLNLWDVHDVGDVKRVSLPEDVIPEAWKRTQQTFLRANVDFASRASRLAVYWLQEASKASGTFLPTTSIFEWHEEDERWKHLQDVVSETVNGDQSVRLSSDGRQLVAGTRSGHVFALDLEAETTGKSVAVGHASNLQTVCFSPDGLYFASGDETGILCVWEARSGKQLHRFRAHTDGIRALRFGLQAKTLFSVGHRDQVFKAWDVATGEERFSEQLTGPTTTLEVSPDGAWVVIGTESGDYAVYDSQTLTRHDASNHAQEILQIAFSPNQDTSLACLNLNVRQQSVIDVMRLEANGELRQANRLSSPSIDSDVVVNHLAISNDGQQLATGSEDGTVIVWDRDPNTGWNVSHEAGIPRHQQAVRSVAFSPYGKQLATASGTSVHLWNLSAANDMLQQLIPLPTEIQTMAFSPDGTVLLTGGSYGLLQLWSVQSGIRQLAQLENIGDPNANWFIRGPRSVALVPSRNLLFTPGFEDEPNMVNAWELRAGSLFPAFELTGATARPGLLVVSPDERFLVAVPAAEASGGIVIWDLESQTIRQQIPVPEERIFTSIILSPDGRTLVGTLSNDEDLRMFLWDVDSGELVREVTAGRDRVSSPSDELYGIAFTPDGRQLITCREFIKVWDFDPNTRALELLREIENPFGNQICLKMAMSSDGRRLAMVAGDGTLYLVDAETLKVIARPLKLNKWGYSVAFSQDNQFVAVGGGGREVRITRTDGSGSLDLVLPGGNSSSGDYITDVTFAPDGNTLIASCADGTVTLWDTTLDRPMPDLAKISQVVNLDVAESGVSWSLSNRALSIPQNSQTFAPFQDFYLEQIDSLGVDRVQRVALLNYYLDHGHDTAARAVLASILEVLSDDEIEAIRNKVGERLVHRAATGSPQQNVAILEMADSLFTRQAPDLIDRFRYALARHRWPEVLETLDAQLSGPPSKLTRTLMNDSGTCFIAGLERLPEDVEAVPLRDRDLPLPPIRLIRSHMLSKYAQLWMDEWETTANRPLPSLRETRLFRLLDHLEQIPGQVLVAPASEWKSVQQADIPAQDWSQLTFDDSEWQRTRLPLNVATALQENDSPKSTVYLRKEITAETSWERLRLSFQVEGSAIFYLDGREIYRYQTEKTKPAGAEGTESNAVTFRPWKHRVLPGVAIAPGRHVLAAEIHHDETHRTDRDVAIGLRPLGPSSRTPESLVETMNWIKRWARHEPGRWTHWLKAFDEPFLSEPPQESSGLALLRATIADAFGKPEEVLQLADRQLPQLAKDPTPKALMVTKRWLALKEAALIKLGRPEEEIEQVRQAALALPVSKQ